MENKKNIKLITMIAILIIVLLGMVMSFFLYSYLTESLILETVNKEPIAINTELYQELKGIPSYGVPVTAEEPGYGRDNPFIPYKTLPSEIEEAAALADTSVNEAIAETETPATE